jgi:AraC-like DNA-binding protein
MKIQRLFDSVCNRPWFNTSRTAIESLTGVSIWFDLVSGISENVKEIEITAQNDSTWVVIAVRKAVLNSKSGIVFTLTGKTDSRDEIDNFAEEYGWTVLNKKNNKAVEKSISSADYVHSVHLFDLLFWRLKRVARDLLLEPDQELDHIGQAKAYMQKNYAKPIQLDDVAQAVHVSSYHLSHLFPKSTGSTFSDALLRIRIEKAKDLLKDTTLTVSDVALETGFNSSTYFTRAFKKWQNMTPSEYRKKRGKRK